MLSVSHYRTWNLCVYCTSYESSYCGYILRPTDICIKCESSDQREAQRQSGSSVLGFKKFTGFICTQDIYEL